MLEDWVRLPAGQEDVRARVRTLERRAADFTPVQPRLDEDGVLHAGTRSVVLPPVEARLAEALIERHGSVVSRDQLAKAGWPEGMADRNLLDVRILRLRRRLADVGLALTTVRHRGYMLVVSDAEQVADTKG